MLSAVRPGGIYCVRVGRVTVKVRGRVILSTWAKRVHCLLASHGVSFPLGKISGEMVIVRSFDLNEKDLTVDAAPTADQDAVTFEH